MKRAKKKSNYLRYILASLFLILFSFVPLTSADEILTTDGQRYEGVIVDQSPSDVAVRLKDKTIKFDRANLKYIKRWSKEKNDVLMERWTISQNQDSNLKAKAKELKFADSVKYSSEPWEIYEEDAFIAFHHQEGIIKSRLASKVADYCRKVADKLGYSKFKLYDKDTSPDWDLKFKFYSYRSFETWKKATAAEGMDVSKVAAFAAGNRRVFFYELYMNEDVIYHEVSHEIYNEFIKNAKIPNWWSEGVAQYTLLTTHEAREDISESRFRAITNKHVSLKKDSYEDIEHVYQDGLSVIYFLIRDKGAEKFYKFNYNLRGGTQFEKALDVVYDFKNINELEKAWVEYLKKIDVKDMVGD